MNILELLFLVSLYALVVGVAAFVLSWTVRTRVVSWYKESAARLHGAGIASQAATERLWFSINRLRSRLTSGFIRFRLPIGFAGLLLVIPMITVFVLGRDRMLEGYSESVADRDPVIVALLEGEQLVPPPALPPRVFATREIQQLRPEVLTASREWQALDADFRQKLLTVFKIMEDRYGYRMALLEGYRSPERQAQLAAMGTHVTRAGAFQSYHQFGLGADSAFLLQGKIVISEKNPWAMRGYQLYGETAELVGLHWGGRWKLQDYGHVELRKRGVLGSKSRKNDVRVMQSE